MQKETRKKQAMPHITWRPDRVNHSSHGGPGRFAQIGPKERAAKAGDRLKWSSKENS